VRVIGNQDAILRDIVALLELLMYFDKKRFVQVGATQLHPSEAHLLQHALRGASFTEMALHFGISKAAVSRAFKRLVDKGIVQVDKDRSEKNRASVRLTQSGKALHLKVEHLQRDLQDEFAASLGGYDPHDLRVIERFIKDLTGYVRGSLLNMAKGDQR
jgi:DNA-binding MarR family transcriptional regulator